MFIEALDIMKIFTSEQRKSKIAALRGIELRIKEGSLVAIIGSSGAGKSTLLNLMGGLDQVSSGHLRVGDTVLSDITISRQELNQYRRSKVGFIWQLPENNLIYRLTAEQQVEMPMKIKGVLSRERRKERVKELLKVLGVNHRAKHRPNQLSGGEMQRVGIAIALANDPDLLLADEPTGELDTKNTLMIIDYFKDLSDNYGKTTIVVTHDHRFENMTKTTFKIKDGQIDELYHSIGLITKDSWKKPKREKYAYVDQFGSVKIPDEIRQKVGIKESVQIRINDEDIENQYVELHPIKTEEDKEGKNDKKK
jgi:ABC-type lipoprotein export system ATPase subunit